MPLHIRALAPADVPAADRIYRLAFGTLFGLAEPLSFRGDGDLVRSRTKAYPDGAIVAESDGEIIGMSLANHWGSLGVLGPVAVHPRFWGQGVAKQMIGPSLESFGRDGSRMLGLFTFPDPAHLGLYQHFGFWPRYLIPILAKGVGPAVAVPAALSLAAAEPGQRAALTAACQALAQEIFPGLDLGREFAAVLDDRLGDVMVLTEGSQIAGFALCHTGPGSEGGSRSCYVKIAQLRAGAAAPARLRDLLAACNGLAARRGAAQLTLGLSSGRHEAHRLLVEQGFRTQLQGVAMHRPWQDAYDRADVFALDDWR